MKIHPIRFPASFLAALTALAALLSSGGSAWASDHLTTSGDWSVSALWNSGAGPAFSSTDLVVMEPGVIGGVTTTISIGELRLGYMNDAATSRVETVDVNTGGNLTVSTLNDGLATGGNAILNVNGGIFTTTGGAAIGAANLGAGGTGTLNLTSGSFTSSSFTSSFFIGSTTATSAGAHGTVTVSGGTFTSANGIQVGSSGGFSTGNTLSISGNSTVNWQKGGPSNLNTSPAAFSIYNGGAVTITGSAATIAFTGASSSGTTFAATAGSTLSFVLDSAGLSTINLNNTALSIASGALLTINGSAYTGGSANFSLFSNVGTITGSFTPTITGFNGYTTVLVPFSNALVLEVTQVPEPGTVALMAAGLGLLAFALRKRILAAA